MVKTFVVDFRGGVNQIVDKTVHATPFVSVLDNGHVRFGGIHPFLMPSFVKDVGDNLVQLYEFRGKFYTSAKYRSYTADYISSIDRVYYSEYGSSLRKIIEGVDVPLGTQAPSLAPGVSASAGLIPSNVKAAEALAGGNYIKDQSVSYRIAFETEDGVQTPSAKVVIRMTAASSGVTLTWSPPSAKVKPTKTIIFAGAEDKERRIADVSPTSVSYTDAGAASTAGEYASSYDQDFEYQYAYTFVRNVVGVENESAPSPLSYTLKSGFARLVTLGASGDGYWRSTNVINYVPNASEQLVVTKTADLGPAVPVTSAALDASDGLVKISAANHQFADGERVLFENFSDTAWNNSVKVVRTIDGSDSQFYVDDIVAPTDVSYTGRTVRRVVSVVIKSIVYDQYVQGLKVTLRTSPQDRHTWLTGDKVRMSGFSDTTWEGQEVEITVSTGNDLAFWIKGMAEPTDSNIDNGSHVATKCVTKIGFVNLDSVNAGFSAAKDLDVFKMTMNKVGDTTKVISGTFYTKRLEAAWGTSNRGVLIRVFTDFSGNMDHATCSMSVVPSNDYIKCRRLYRVGGTGELLRVADIDLATSEYIDGKVGERLGDPIPSFYTENGIDILYDIPPIGGEGLVSHYGMKFCIDNHTVRWTPIGVPDAWPQVCSLQFPYKPVKLESFAQALVVLCEDAIYRIDGASATSLTQSKTLAEDGCVAPGSVQRTSAGLIYLSKRGLMAFNGQSAECITDNRILGKWMLGPAYTSDSRIYDFWWLPSSWTKLVQDMSKRDGLAQDPEAPRVFEGSLPIMGINRAIRSFVHQGKYFMYWAKGHDDYIGHAMICIDLQAEGFPITTLGFKPVDVCVSDMDEAYCLLDRTKPSGV